MPDAMLALGVPTTRALALVSSSLPVQREVRAGDADLLNRWLTLLQRAKADFTLAFRQLADVIETDSADALLHLLTEQDGALRDWLNDWRARLASEGGAAPMRNYTACWPCWPGRLTSRKAQNTMPRRSGRGGNWKLGVRLRGARTVLHIT